MLENYNIVGCKSRKTPMLPGCSLPKVEGEMPGIPYQQLIRSLLFLARYTRPDISFVVARVSQHLRAYNEEDWQSANNVLRYVQGSKNLCITYPVGSHSGCYRYWDSDYPGDHTDRKSTSGFIFFHNDSPVSWMSQKQSIVACSSTEAEYVALWSAAREAVWLKQLASEIEIPIDLSIPIHIDN